MAVQRGEDVVDDEGELEAAHAVARPCCCYRHQWQRPPRSSPRCRRRSSRRRHHQHQRRRRRHCRRRSSSVAPTHWPSPGPAAWMAAAAIEFARSTLIGPQRGGTKSRLNGVRGRPHDGGEANGRAWNAICCGGGRSSTISTATSRASAASDAGGLYSHSCSLISHLLPSAACQLSRLITSICGPVSEPSQECSGFDGRLARQRRQGGW